MNVSDHHSTVEICLGGDDAGVSMGMDSTQDKKHKGSALQNPELRRLELVAMLRRAARRAQSKKSKKTYWAAFMSGYVGKNANSNDS
ncbi:MAG: hypothetical protein H6867_01315 [Rhodospirillales bacterium]|nr:hypothetical protein [Rhodospirillales bacterium]MCB9997155.1 hypothetical protein [Rhodospirillales bacterium]